MNTKHYQLTFITAMLSSVSVSNAVFFAIHDSAGLAVSSRAGLGQESAAGPFLGALHTAFSSPLFGTNLLAFRQGGVARWTQSNAQGFGGSWVGNFEPGEALYHYDRLMNHQNVLPTQGMGGVLIGDDTIISLANSDGALSNMRLSAIGFHFQTEALGAFTAQIRVWDDSVGRYSEWFTRDGMSTSQADGSAIFLGIGSTSTFLSRIQVRARSYGSTTYGRFAISSARFSTSPVPEPTTMAALALGLATIVRRRKSA